MKNKTPLCRVKPQRDSSLWAIVVQSNQAETATLTSSPQFMPTCLQTSSSIIVSEELCDISPLLNIHNAQSALWVICRPATALVTVLWLTNAMSLRELSGVCRYSNSQEILFDSGAKLSCLWSLETGLNLNLQLAYTDSCASPGTKMSFFHPTPSQSTKYSRFFMDKTKCQP